MQGREDSGVATAIGLLNFFKFIYNLNCKQLVFFIAFLIVELEVLILGAFRCGCTAWKDFLGRGTSI